VSKGLTRVRDTLDVEDEVRKIEAIGEGVKEEEEKEI
jgi:hypothetical protein